MTEQNWFRHAVQIGQFEFRRSVRALRQDRARFTLMVLGVIVPTLMITGVGVLLAAVLDNIAGQSIPDQLRGMVALFWLFGVFMISQRVASAKRRIEAEPLMLTSVSARTVVSGLLIAEFLRILVYFAFPALAIGSLLAYVLTAPTLLVTVLLAIIVFGATAATAGSIIGYGVALILASSPFVARHKTSLSIIAALLGVVGYLSFQYSSITGLNQVMLAWLPITWVADIAALGAPINGSPLHALGVIIGSAIFILIGGLIAERETMAYWFADGPTKADPPDENQTPSSSTDERLESAQGMLARTVSPFRADFLALPIRRVAQMAVLRAWRDPRRLMFILMPVFIFGSSIAGSTAINNPLTVLPVASAVLIPWVAGALFSLNPLGDEGPVLPVTLTAATSTHYVQGLIAPGLILGLPTAVVLTGSTAALSPYSVLTQLSLIVLAIYVTLVSVALGPLIGMTFPRFEAISAGQADEVIPPRITAIALHVIAVGVPSSLLALLVVMPQFAQTVVAVLIGTFPSFVLGLIENAGVEQLTGVAAWFITVGETIQAIPLTTFRITAGSILISSGTISAIAAYRGAIHRFNEYSPP